MESKFFLFYLFLFVTEMFDVTRHSLLLRITTEEFSRMWNKGNVETVKPFIPHNFLTGRSVRKEIIRRSDGTIEQKQIIRDSEGNEEMIVTKEIGDKKYVITTKKDKNGVETKSEDLFNIDESKYLKEKKKNYIYIGYPGNRPQYFGK